MDSKVVFAIFVVLLLCTDASAFSFQGLIDWFNGLFSSPTTTEAKDAAKVVCNPPYIQVGKECCLDRDGNGICDRDETTTTEASSTTAQAIEEGTSSTSLKASTTSTTASQAASTTLAAASTTTLPAACKVNADCGQNLEELLCKDGDVYVKKTIYICTKPGTASASCIGKITAAKSRDCGELYCFGGECVESVDSITTTLQGATTTTTGQHTTTSQAGHTTTTTQLLPATPVCGDGKLSWSGAGGSEECELPSYPCPSGLSCVNCKCVGCGDGRLQAGEQCDPNNKMSRVNGQPLWAGQTSACTGQYQMCDSGCKCVSSVSCQGDLLATSNCDGKCNSACEACSQYLQTPCYKCEKDCGKIGAAWGDSSKCATCDSQHEQCTQSDTCSGCYHCVTTCPDAQGYYNSQGCAGKCDARLCAKVGSGQYANCYKCNAPRCGDGAITQGEECEKDADCGQANAKCAGCLCQFDCQGYCATQGANGFKVAAGPATKAACDNTADAAAKALAGQCKATCWASMFFEYKTPRGSQTCCCTDADWKQCPNCPCTEGVNCPVDCTGALAQCKVGL